MQDAFRTKGRHQLGGRGSVVVSRASAGSRQQNTEGERESFQLLLGHAQFRVFNKKVLVSVLTLHSVLLDFAKILLGILVVDNNKVTLFRMIKTEPGCIELQIHINSPIWS